MAEVNESRIYIGNLPFNIGFQELKEFFSKFGEITESTVIADKDTRRSKGFGFVTFKDSAAAEKAIAEMNGKDFNERTINVKLAVPPKEREERFEKPGKPRRKESRSANLWSK